MRIVIIIFTMILFSTHMLSLINESIRQRHNLSNFDPINNLRNQNDKFNNFAIIAMLCLGFILGFHGSLFTIIGIFVFTYVALSIGSQILNSFSPKLSNIAMLVIFILMIVTYYIVTLSSLLTIDGYSFKAGPITDHIIALFKAQIQLFILTFLVSLFNTKNTSIKSFDFDNIKKSFAPTHSNNKIQHYRDHGLSDEDIKYLRGQLATLRDQIHALDNQMNQTAKLRAIDVRHNTINISKRFFQDIVHEPNRVGEVSHVIYRLIPSLVDLTTKYNEVNDHIAKNKQSYMILDKTAVTIEELAENLADQYIAFHQTTFNDLDDEIEYAKRTLLRENKQDEDSIDQILNNWSDNKEEEY